MDIRIYYEDTDCGGVVYYANYLRYFEWARTEYLERRGLSVKRLAEEGTQFMVVHAEVDYRFPARYGDVLSIETTVAGVGNASLTMAHVLRMRDSGRVVAEGSAKLVTVDRRGKTKRLPDAIRTALREPAGDRS